VWQREQERQILQFGSSLKEFSEEKKASTNEYSDLFTVSFKE
jgi:hypothetical protein